MCSSSRSFSAELECDSWSLRRFLTCPIERLKILQQSYPTHLAQPSTFSLFTTLLRTAGLRSLYRGLSVTMLRDIGYGPYFLTYEAVSRGWPGAMRSGRADLVEEVEAEGLETNWTRLLVAGGAAGMVGWGITCVALFCSRAPVGVGNDRIDPRRFDRFPLDVVKTRIQATETHLVATASTPRRPHPYRTIASTFAHSYRTEGIRVFSAGLGPTLLRSVPVNMICFFVFEAVVAALR